MAPTLAAKIGRRTAEDDEEPQPSHTRPIAANGGDCAAGKLCPSISAYFALARLARAAIGGLSSTIASRAMSSVWTEK